MAEKRMFAKNVIDSDLFLDMPLSTQALYFHLAMRADDDGFVNNPKKIKRLVGAADDDLKVLISKNFLIPFESGVVVIRHWKIHNYIRKDTYKPTVYEDEKSRLSVNASGLYCDEAVTALSQSSDETVSQISIDKISIDKIRSDKGRKRFAPPTLEEVKAYCIERNNSVDAQRFIDYYTSNGWKVGKNPMKDWKAAVRNWERDSKPQSKPQSKPKNSSYDISDWERYAESFDPNER